MKQIIKKKTEFAAFENKKLFSLQIMQQIFFMFGALECALCTMKSIIILKSIVG